MNNAKHLSWLAGVALFIMSCSPFKVVSDFDESINFSQYKTYSLQTNDLNLNDLDEKRVTNELKKQLAAKGLNQAETSDLIIQIKASHKTITDNYYTSPNVYIGGWGYWGMGLGLNNIYTQQYQYNQGSLTFDFVDAKTGKLVWQGKGNGINVDSPKSKQKQIPEIIAEILKHYTPKKQ